MKVNILFGSLKTSDCVVIQYSIRLKVHVSSSSEGIIIEIAGLQYK